LGVPSPKSQDQVVGVPVEVSVKVVFTGTVPDTGVAVNDATGAMGAARLSSANQYRWVTSLEARTTSPLVALTGCLVVVRSLRLGEAASWMIGVPRPG